jgi:hypothetical protein
MTNDPKQIGNICRSFVAPVLTFSVGFLTYLQNDPRTLKGLLTGFAWAAGTAFFCTCILPYALNFFNMRVVARRGDTLVKESIAELCKSLFANENWIESFRQKTPSTVAGKIAKSQILAFLSSKPSTIWKIERG